MKLALDRIGDVNDCRTGETWDPQKLRREVSSRVGELQKYAVNHGDYVVIAHGGTPAFFADLFAVWERGACAVCVNPGSTAFELTNIVSFTQAKAVLGIAEKLVDLSGTSIPVVELGKDTTAGRAVENSSASTLDDPALILFTSGTTGEPKGVVHTHRSLSARIELNRIYIGVDKLARSLCTLPTHFGHGLIGNCLTPLLSGCDLFLYSSPSVRDLASVGDILDTEAITFMSSVPSFWKLALKVASPPVAASLRQVNIGSAPLSKELWEAVIEWTRMRNVVNTYGITETANWIAAASAESVTPADGLIGRMWGGHAAVLDPRGQLICAGEGELVVQTPALMQGYHQRSDLTQRVLRSGWFYTGDHGHIAADGTIYLTGRIKDEINRAGLKVYPEELDNLIERHDKVAEACVFGVPDEMSGELVAAAVCAAAGETLTAKEMREWCSQYIRREAIPQRWFFIHKIPKTERGKVSRTMVRDVCLSEVKQV